METNGSTNELAPSPKWSDYPGLVEHVAADFAKMAALPDTEIKAKTLVTLDQPGMIEAFNSLRDNHPEKAAAMFGISVEEVQKMSAVGLLERERERIERMSPEEMRKEISDGQKHYNSLSGAQDAGDTGI